MRTVQFLSWSIPLFAVELAIIALIALGLALVVTAVRLWRDQRAYEAAWDAQSDGAGWDDQDQADALRIAAEARWRADLAAIHAETVAIDQWRDAGYPADRQPYAITAAEKRSDANRAERRRLSLAAAETLVRMAA